MAAPPSPKCSVSCNSTWFFFQSLCSPAQISKNTCQEFSRSLTGRRCGWLWRLCWLRRVEADGNKEEEGCLLPGSFHPKPSLSPRPTPPPGSRLTRFPCLLKRQKGHRLLCCRNCKLQQQTSKGIEQHGRFCWGGDKYTPVGHFSNSNTGNNCDGTHIPSEMMGVGQKCFAWLQDCFQLEIDFCSGKTKV